MYRLSLVINEIYNKYLPEALKLGVEFNLDFPDPTLRVESPSRVKKHLDEHVPKAILRVSNSSKTIATFSSAARSTSSSRKKKGEVRISVLKDGVEIRDTGTTLSPAAVKLLSSERVEIKSRVGFGTRVMIYFSKK